MSGWEGETERNSKNKNNVRGKEKTFGVDFWLSTAKIQTDKIQQRITGKILISFNAQKINM